MIEENIEIWEVSPERTQVIKRVSVPIQPHSLDEATRQLPPGAYTTFRTFGRYGILRLSDHFQRLEETSRLTGLPSQLDWPHVKSALRQVLQAYPPEEARVRVILDLEQAPGTIYLLLEPLQLPSAQEYRNGVQAVTRVMQRANPKAKLTMFIDMAASARQDLPANINEVIMVGQDGRFLEGLSSNFFAVKEGVVWTAEEGVLSGITRSLVLDVIRIQAFPLHREGLPVEALPLIDEAFLTSASRAVLPVVNIDGMPVGDGRPGPITLAVLRGYFQMLHLNLEHI